MSAQQTVTAVCAVATVIQGIAASVSLYDRFQFKELEVVTVSKRKALILSIALGVSTAGAGIVTGWLWTFQPTPIEKPVIVEKAVPCPPSQSGPASTQGEKSPAMSGSNNSVNYGQEPPSKK